jgi:putative nucleotidyltransferase with HDIG domain
MWRHAVAVAAAAVKIAEAVDSDVIDTVFMAGLLHDVGKMVLDPYVCERTHLFARYRAVHPERPLYDAEREVLGFDHAVIAAILCENWDLPRSIAFAIRQHHQPSSAGDHILSHIVHLADWAISQTKLGSDEGVRCQRLNAASRSRLPLEKQDLQRIAADARLYVDTMSRHINP